VGERAGQPPIRLRRDSGGALLHLVRESAARTGSRRSPTIPRPRRQGEAIYLRDDEPREATPRPDAPTGGQRAVDRAARGRVALHASRGIRTSLRCSSIAQRAVAPSRW
jgi:hypothetical protein